MEDRWAQGTAQVASERAGAGAPFTRAWPAAPESVSELRRAVVDVVRGCGATPAALAAVELAVSEAANNAVQHAYADAPRPGQMIVTVESQDGVVVVVVADDGCGMRPRPRSSGLGLGLPLISQMTQSFEVLQPRKGGTVLCMRFDSQRGQL
jgi:serine/threonine-protein kinase RsbW/stage II sporulation protein AB (anti-sigma F factor)